VPQDPLDRPDPQLRERREAWEAQAHQAKPAAKDKPARRDRPVPWAEQERLVIFPDRRVNRVQLARLDRQVLLALLGLPAKPA